MDDNFSHAELIENQGNSFTFHVDNSDMPLSQTFAIMEGTRDSLNVKEYSISQTTLEQIFNRFASKQQGMRSADGMRV